MTSHLFPSWLSGFVQGVTYASLAYVVLTLVVPPLWWAWLRFLKDRDTFDRRRLK